MAQIKGTALRGLLKHAKDSVPGGVPALIAALPERSRGVFDHRVLASSWYPYQAYADLLEGLAGGARDRAAYLHELGRHLAVQDAGTTFQVVALFASVETMLQRASLFWTRHCDTGRFETLETAKGSGVGALRDFPGVSPLHCTLLTGWIEGMGEAAGASEATTEKVKCVHRGDPWCEYHGRWT